MTSARLVDRIDHVVVAVHDVTAAGPAMARLLGCAPCWEGLQPADGTSSLLFRLANTTIELLAPEGEGPIATLLRARLEAAGEGLFRLDFGTAHLDAVCDSLKTAGFAAPPPGDGLAHDEPSGAWRRFRFVEISPDQNRGVRTRVVEDTSPDAIVPEAQPLSGDGSCVGRVDHVVIMTREPDHALAFYGDALGLRLALDRTFEKRGVRLIFFRTGGLTLEIGSSLSAQGEAGGLGAPGDDADLLWGIAHQVADAERARARLIDTGFDVTPIRDGHKPGTRVFTVKDAPFAMPTLFIEPVAQP